MNALNPRTTNLPWRAAGLAILLTLGWFTGRAFRSANEQASAPLHSTQTNTEAGPAAVASAGLWAQPNSEFLTRVHSALGIQGREKRTRAIARISDQLNAAQIRKAIEQIQKSRLPNQREILAQLFARWGEIEPLAAMDFVNRLGRGSDRSRAITSILNGWMENDPEAAEAWVDKLPAGALRKEAWQTVIAAHAAIDPKRALALAEHAKVVDLWTAIPIFGSWTVKNPEEAAACASKVSDDYLRMNCLSVVARQWAEADPERALAWAQSLPDLLAFRQDGFGNLSEICGADRTNAVVAAIDTWLKRDGDAMVRWLAELPDDHWKQGLVSTAFAKCVDSTLDPRLLIQLTHLLPENEQRDQTIGVGVSRLSMIDTQAGLAMLSQESDPKVRLTILRALVGTLKGDDLLSALNQMQGNDGTIEKLAHWRDPETAARWAAQQRNGESYFPEIGAAWMNANSEQAEKWIKTLPASATDDVLAAVVWRASPPGSGTSSEEKAAHFQKTARWIPEIVDPQKRETAYRQLATRWMQYHRESGRRWLDSIPISNEAKSEVLNASAE